MALDAQTLITEGECYLCAGTSAFEAIELALLARISGGGPPPDTGTKYLVTSDNYSPPAGAYVTISAQLADASNNPVTTAGITVTWSKTGAGGSFASATSVTNASGIATVQFTTGLVIGTAYVVTATDTSARTGSTSTITTVMVLDTFESYGAGPLAGLNGGTGWIGAYFDAFSMLSTLNDEWVGRCYDNGSADRPSSTIFSANDTFYAALVSAGIDTKLSICNTFAPTNLATALTPLIFGGGSRSWANVGAFVSGDLTVNGLIGNGTNYLNTGWSPRSVMTSGSSHSSIYVFADDKTTGQNEYGSNDGGDALRGYLHYTDNNTYFTCYNVLINAIITTGSLTGYLCGSRTTTTRFDAYYANSGNPHSSVFNSTGANALAAPIAVLVVFATNEVGTISNHSKKRLSYASFGLGLSSTESLAEYNAVQALRTSYGGGAT